MAWTWQIIPNFAKLSDFVANCAFQFWKFYRDFIIPRENNAMVLMNVIAKPARKEGGKKKKIAATFESKQVNLRISSSHCTISFFFFSLRQLRHRLPSERHRDVNIVSPGPSFHSVFNWIFSNDIAIELRHRWNFLPPRPFSHATSYKADALWTLFSSNNRRNIATDFSSIFLWNGREK